jgi:hypothetical protein
VRFESIAMAISDHTSVAYPVPIDAEFSGLNKRIEPSGPWGEVQISSSRRVPISHRVLIAYPVPVDVEGSGLNKRIEPSGPWGDI